MFYNPLINILYEIYILKSISYSPIRIPFIRIKEQIGRDCVLFIHPGDIFTLIRPNHALISLFFLSLKQAIRLPELFHLFWGEGAYDTIGLKRSGLGERKTTTIVKVSIRPLRPGLKRGKKDFPTIGTRKSSKPSHHCKAESSYLPFFFSCFFHSSLLGWYS